MEDTASTASRSTRANPVRNAAARFEPGPEVYALFPVLPVVDSEAGLEEIYLAARRPLRTSSCDRFANTLTAVEFTARLRV